MGTNAVGAGNKRCLCLCMKLETNRPNHRVDKFIRDFNAFYYSGNKDAINDFKKMFLD